MRVLIAGIAGHVGSSFGRWILDNRPGCEIVGVDNFSSGFVESVPEGVEFLQSDVCEAAKSLAGRFDAVYHFAAFAAETLSPFVRKYTINNVWGETAALLNHLVSGDDCGRLVFASSVAVYGRGNGKPPFTEDCPRRPIDPYGIAKLAAEYDIQSAAAIHGLDYCILRMHNIYGPGQNIWDRHRNVFGLWMRAALEKKTAAIFGDGKQRRAFTYIDDIMPCLWEAGFSPQASKQTINLGGSRPWAIGEAAQAFADVLQGDAPAMEYQPARHEVKCAWCSADKSRDLLGFDDLTPEYVGLDAMWRWAKEAWEAYPERRDRADAFQIEVSPDSVFANQLVARP